MKPGLLLSMVLSLSIHAGAFNDDSLTIRSIANEVFTSGSAYRNLEYLCKHIGPRLSGSANAGKAVAWGMKAMKEAGADTVYLQPCMVMHWVHGSKESGWMVMKNGSDSKKFALQLTALGNSVGTGPQGISGPVVEVKNFDELDKLGEAGVKGKIVFLNYPMNPLFVSTFDAYEDAAKYRVRGPAKAAKYGAVGVMVRSLASNEDTHPHAGVTFYGNTSPKIPAVAISTYDANRLSSYLSQGSEVVAGFITNCVMEKDTLSYNVIGEIRGSEKPEEIITVGGHLDSWDLAEGAQDDGAGCVQSIEVLRVIKQNRLNPKRTIRAVLFMNEENGAGGAKAYYDSAVSKKEKHIFALESDAGGYTPRGFRITAGEKPFARLEKWVPLLKPYGVYYLRKTTEGDVDVSFLEKAGAVLAGLEPDSQRYFDMHHSETDVFEGVSKRELELGAINMAALVWLVSNYGLN